ncbi:hypothetical protein KO361_02825 [Candidatus Woesearchaeota archaeon]|nr:hypothetical protein [Candidatus Woesearchaeota archaeon]
MEITTQISLNSEKDPFIIKNLNGEIVFVKNYLLKQKEIRKTARIIKEKLTIIEKKFLQHLLIANPKNLIKEQYKETEETTREILEKEYLTNKLWITNNIPTPVIISITNTELISDYVPSKTFHELIGKEYKPETLQEMINLYQKIRMIALEQNNPNILHTDPHPSNFIKSTKTGQVLALDSSFKLKQNKTTTEIDCLINGLFALQLSRLNSKPEIYEAHAELYLQSLGKDAKKIKLPRMNPASKTYFELREKIAHKIMGREYNSNEAVFKAYESLKKMIPN